MDEIKIKITRYPEKGWTGEYTIELEKLTKPIKTGSLIETEIEWGEEETATAIILARVVGFDIDLTGFPTIILKCVVQGVINENVYENDISNINNYRPLETDLVYIFIDDVTRVFDDSDDWLSKEEIEKFMVNYYKKN